MPVFSVIMPVWNRADIFARALKSVLSQNFNDFEVIIIDDGSDDDLESVVRPYLSRKVKYFKICHNGQAKARNEGLARASGKFIAYLDSDNVWYPEFLNEMHKALRSSDLEIASAYCLFKLIKKKKDGSIVVFKKYGQGFNFEKLIENSYIDINSFVHSKACIGLSGLFDESLQRLVDWDFIIRVSQKVKPIFIPKVLLDYHLNFFDNSVSLTADFKQAKEIIRNKYKGLLMPKKKTFLKQMFDWLVFWRCIS